MCCFRERCSPKSSLSPNKRWAGGFTFGVSRFLWFGIFGSGFRHTGFWVGGSGFCHSGLGFRVSRFAESLSGNLRFDILGFELAVQGFAFGVRGFQGVTFGVRGFGFWVLRYLVSSFGVSLFGISCLGFSVEG